MARLFNADEIFTIGVQIEKNGNAFYAAAAAHTDDPDLKKLFLQLAEWEQSHVAIFEDLRFRLPAETKAQDVYDPDNMVHRYLKAVADDNVFVKGLTLSPDLLVWTSPLKVLNTALDFEKDSVVFFSSMKDAAISTTGAAEVEKLVLEELKHIGYLTGEIRKLGE
ncbi:MAG: ferritin family protein [Chitinispirillaceae bacterium]|nr:ferritin family protein [Chitinispirillaceae bacterium]